LKEFSPLLQVLTSFSVLYFLPWKHGVGGVPVCVQSENGGASGQGHSGRV